MADNQNIPGGQGSNQSRSTGKELLDSLKEQLRLEGDYRDILRDSVRELQKSIKQHDTITAKLEAYSNTAINIKQVQREMNNNLIKQNINKIKLNEATKKLGGLESDQVKTADQYLKSLEERSELEDSYLKKRSEVYTLENKFKEGKEEEFKSVTEYFKKLEDQRKLEDYIADLSERKGKNAQKDLAFNQQKLTKLKDELSIQQNSFTLDQQEYINGKNVLNQIDSEVKKKEGEISIIQQGLNLEQAAYIQAKKTNELYDSNNEKLKEQEEFEKRSQKNAGILGGLIGGLANKFGIAEQVQENMVAQQKLLAAEAIASGRKSGTFKDKLSVAKTGIKSIGAGLVDNLKTDPIMKYGVALGAVGLAYKGLKAGLDMVGNAAAAAGNFMAGLTEDSSTIVRGLTSGISDLARKIPLVGGLVGGLIDGFSAVLDLIIGVDDKIIKAGRQLNMSAGEARAFNRSLQDVSFNSNNLFVNSKKLLESQVELSNQLGITNKLSNEQLQTNIMLKDIAGLEADVRQRIVEISSVSGKTSQGTVKTILAQVEGLKKATGIEFQSQKILKDVASQSGYIGLQFTKYPAQLTKSLLTVKAMGLELKDLDSIANSFLDFESSISKEFEAQLLTGKNINLTKAREAFLNNDLATAASEINSQVGSSADFLKLNRIQAESLSEAFGMSRDQLAEMLRQQEVLSTIGAKQGDTAREQLKLGLEKYKNSQALSQALGEENYQALVQASTQEKIAAFIDKIKQSVVDFVERAGIIEKIERFVKMLENPDTIQGILGKIRDTISTFIGIVGEILADVIEVGGEIANLFTFGRKGDEREAAAYALGAKIRASSIQMAENIKAVGGETISVSDKVAKERVTTNQTVQQPAQQPNTMMAKPDNLNVHVTTYVSDVPKDAQARFKRSGYSDQQTGLMT